jgi:hypothetical protein
MLQVKAIRDQKRNELLAYQSVYQHNSIFLDEDEENKVFAETSKEQE